MYAVELVHGERYTVLRSRNTIASLVDQIFEDRHRCDFFIDRLLVVYHLLRRLRQRLCCQVAHQLIMKNLLTARM